MSLRRSCSLSLMISEGYDCQIEIIGDSVTSVFYFTIRDEVEVSFMFSGAFSSPLIRYLFVSYNGSFGGKKLVADFILLVQSMHNLFFERLYRVPSTLNLIISGLCLDREFVHFFSGLESKRMVILTLEFSKLHLVVIFAYSLY